MQRFEIWLKNEKIKTYRLISLILLFTQIVAFIYLSFFTSESNARGAARTALLIQAIIFLLQRYFRNSKYAFGLTPFLFFCTIAWISAEYYWIAGISLLFQILAELAMRKPLVIISENEIFYPAFIMRRIDWKELNNTILKDGLLTIDFKNNRIIQQEVDPAKTNVNETDFNEFCRRQLS